MRVSVLKNIMLPDIDEREAMRYASVMGADGAAELLLRECKREISGMLTPLVAYAELPFEISDDRVDFGLFSVESHSLSRSLYGSPSALIFCATLGTAFDRLVTKYSKLSPAKALILSALGTERIEALCDAFIKEYEERTGRLTKPRFSPGYGDLPLSLQREIFAVLNPERHIGVTLGESLLMTPIKSVTAFLGTV